MATATKKPRTSVEAYPQLATMPERVATLEVKVSNIDEKIGDIKSDLGANHTDIIETLKTMRDESTKQHNELAGKVKDLEGFKNKWLRWTMMGLAFAAGAGWIHQDFSSIIKFLGL
jgi:uncharacterized phage infection (PIP) family protein YhgE